MRKKNIINNEIKDLFLNQKGMALLTTLIFVFILVTFAVALLTMTSNDTKLSTLQRDSTKAFYLADAGIEKALWYLNTPKDLGGKGLNWPTDGGVTIEEGSSNEYFKVTVQYEPVVVQTDTIKITSIGTVKEGKYSSGKRTVVVTAKIGISPSDNVSYNHTFFTDGNMIFNGGSITISGSMHSNSDITDNGKVVDLKNGIATAFGATNIGIGGQPIQDFPKIDWEYFKSLAKLADEDFTDSIEGHYYGDNTSVVFDTNNYLNGMHFIDGDVKIQAILTLNSATIFATGTIDVIGSGDVNLINSPSTPLALIAKEDITISGIGSVRGEGIIQTEANFNGNGNVNIEGAIYAAVEGELNGAPTLVYNAAYAGMKVPGTGVEVYIKTSWREAY
jgi:Tfp pilus assembly protein PilX